MKYIHLFGDLLSRFGSDELIVGPGLPVPRNIIQWVEGPEFLNIPSIWKYIPHLEILRDFYELLCPYCNAEPAYGLSASEFKKQILLEKDICPRCHGTKLELAKEKLIKGPLVLALATGMRSGKTSIGSYMGSFSMMTALLFQGKFQEYYELLPGQDVEFSFLAASEVQSRDTVWAAMNRRIDNSPWFQTFFSWIRQTEKEKGLPKESLFSRNMTRMDFNPWGLHFVNLPRNASTSTGRTRAFVCIDELSRFERGDSKLSADEIYDAQNASLSTLWQKNQAMLEKGVWPKYHPFMVCVGAPWLRKDRMMTLVTEDATKTDKIIGVKKATWEMNPEYPRDGEFIQDKYRVDPVGAERDYGANPPGAENPAFDPDKIEVCVDRGRKSILEYRIDHIETRVQEAVFPYTRIKLLHCTNDLQTPRYIHCDPGRTNHAFGIAIVHKLPFNGGWKFIVDAVISIKAKRERTGDRILVWEVDFHSVLEFLLELGKHINIHTISFDRWQPGNYLDALRRKGLRATQFSVTRATYIDFKNDLEDFRVVIPGAGPEGNPEALAIEELKTLNDDGVKVTPTQSDDLAQCVVAAHHHAKCAEAEMWGMQRGTSRTLHPQNFNTVPRHRRPGRFVHLGRY